MTETPRQTLKPEVGRWLVRLGKNTPRVPAAIMWVETTAEPGEPQNDMHGTRSPFLAAFIAGEPVGLDEVWLRRGEPISELEYRFQIADGIHAKAFRPGDPKAEPRKQIDLMQVPLPF